MLNPMQEQALKKLMTEDMQTNVSAYFASMIVEITKRRAEETKRPVGRPKKDDEEDDEEMVLHPDQISIGNKGRMITKGQYNELARRSGRPELD